MKATRSASVYENLFKVEPTKSQQQQLSIIEAAIKSFVTEGVQGTTYAALAKTVGISRPLIHHYFPEYNDLIRQSAVYVRTVMQEHGFSYRKAQAQDAASQLKAYLDGHFIWLEKYPHHSKFWLLNFYMSGTDKKSRLDHTEMTDMDWERIEKLIREGAEEKKWPAPTAGKQTAKMIQAMVTGTMMVAMTESSEYSTKELSNMLSKNVIRLLKS